MHSAHQPSDSLDFRICSTRFSRSFASGCLEHLTPCNLCGLGVLGCTSCSCCCLVINWHRRPNQIVQRLCTRLSSEYTQSGPALWAGSHSLLESTTAAFILLGWAIGSSSLVPARTPPKGVGYVVGAPSNWCALARHLSLSCCAKGTLARRLLLEHPIRFCWHGPACRTIKTGCCGCRYFHRFGVYQQEPPGSLLG
jgi:hypothetical protein